MPIEKTIYDKETGQALVRDALTAAEAVQNDPGRYSYKPWKTLAVSDRDKAKVAKAKPAAKGKPGKPAVGVTADEAATGDTDPFDHDLNGDPGGSLPKADRT